ncbi:hypothetical protein NKH99_28390 [Mesorhizobium sp. M0854]|uniref:hypothetical protein n=1 Tax=Mesorhizobium sp. M0854 TaxID=2957013 RepID=UPI003336823C
MRREIADAILSGNNLNYRKWLAQEAGGLALRIANLDEIPPLAILPLAKIAAYGEANARRLAIACDMELDDLQDHIDALCEVGFAEETANGFNITPLGERAFIAVGKNMIIRERLELKGRLEQIGNLYDKMNNADIEFH